MAFSRDAQRRWLGGICLAISAAMLILGQTVLKNKFSPRTFIFYWITCTLFTGLTLLIALFDLRAVRLRSQNEQAKLMESVLREIEREKNERQNRNASDNSR